MSSNNRCKEPSSSSISNQSTADPPPPRAVRTRSRRKSRAPRALPFRRHPSSMSTVYPSGPSSDPLPPQPPQGTQVPFCPTNNSPEHHTSIPVPRSGSQQPPYRSFLELLGRSRLFSESPTPPTSNDSTPPSQSASPAQQSAPSQPSPTPNHTTGPQRLHPRSNRGDHGPSSQYLPPQSSSSRQSYSGDTLVDESDPPGTLGSAILVPGTTPAAGSRHRSYEGYRYGTLQRHRLAPQALPQNILIDGTHPVPIAQWPEVAQGIIPFMNLTEERVKNALPYFRSSIPVLNPDLTTNREGRPPSHISPIRPNHPHQQDYATQRAANGLMMPRPDSSDPRCFLSSPQRQRQAITEFSDAYATMAGNDQTSEARPESYAGVRRSDTTGAMWLSGSGNGRTARVLSQEYLIAQTPQPMPTAWRGNFRYSNRSIAWHGASHRFLETPPRMQIPETPSFPPPSDSRRWYGSPPRFNPPRPTYTPTMARPNLGGPPSYAYLSGALPGAANAPSMRRLDFWHRPDFPVPRPVSGQPVAGMQGGAQPGSSRGRGTPRGRDVQPWR